MIFAIQVGNATLALPTVNRVKAGAEIRQQKEAARGSWRGCARLNIASISSTACHGSVLTKSSSVHASIHRVAASTLWRSVQLFTRFSYKELKVIVELDRGCVLQHCSHLLPPLIGVFSQSSPVMQGQIDIFRGSRGANPQLHRITSSRIHGYVPFGPFGNNLAKKRSKATCLRRRCKSVRSTCARVCSLVSRAVRNAPAVLYCFTSSSRNESRSLLPPLAQSHCA